MLSPRNAVLVAVFPAYLFFSVWIFEGQPNIQLVVGSMLLSLYGIVALVDQFNWWRRTQATVVHVVLEFNNMSLAFPVELQLSQAVDCLMSLKEGERERHKSGFWLSRKRRRGKKVWRSL